MQQVFGQYYKQTYSGDEQSGGGFVEDHEGKVAFEVANNMAGWVGCSITKGLVGFDD